MEIEFKKNTAFIIPYILDKNTICTSNCLRFIDIESIGNDVYIDIYYQPKSKQQYFWLLSKARENVSYFNNFQSNINGNVYTTVRFSVKENLLWLVKMLSSMKYKNFDKTTIITAVLFWKEHIYKILEKEETPIKLKDVDINKTVKELKDYIENLIQKVNDEKTITIKKTLTANEDIVVLLAPSWGEKGFLNYYKTDFIETMAKQGFQLILRPHPQSVRVEKKLLQKVEKRLKPYTNIRMDYEPDATTSFEAADILISDVSEIRFEFAMAYQKPFITIPLAMTQKALQEFEIADLGSSWTEEAMQKIGYGYTLKDNEIEYLDKIILKILQEKNNDAIVWFRNNNIYNLGKSGEVIADYLINTNKILQDEMKREKS